MDRSPVHRAYAYDTSSEHGGRRDCRYPPQRIYGEKYRTLSALRPDPPPVYAGRIEVQQVILIPPVNAVESLDGVSSEYRAINRQIAEKP